MPTIGRTSNKLSSQIRDQIRNGEMETSGYLPPIRELSREHGLAMRTVQRALGALEREGLIVSEPRRGYRVLARSHDPNRGMPLAFLLSSNIQPDSWDAFDAMLARAFQQAAVQRGWSMLALSTSERSVAEVIDQLRMARACGAVLDTLDPELIRAAAHLGLPVVMVDAWVEQTPVDAVLQDNYRGGFIAAEHLYRKGHRKIHWFGPLNDTPHGRERFGGAAAMLAAAGCAIAPESIVASARTSLDRDAMELLARPDRPRAILALFRDAALAIAKAARARGLDIGRDLDLVGWCVDELYEDGYKALMTEGRVPPAICWSMAEMSETALRARRRAPDRAGPAGVAYPRSGAIGTLENRQGAASMRNTFHSLIICAIVITAGACCQEIKFSTPPSVAKAGEGATIAFAVSEKTDVEVAVIGANGDVVRHLAAGVLGGEKAPPEPLKPGLSQSLTWDGKDDFGKPAKNGPFKVRARAGSQFKFGRFIGEDPYTFGAVDGLGTDEDGNLYISSYAGTHNQGERTLRVYDGQGHYLREIMPFPASMKPDSMKNVARWDGPAKVWRPTNYSCLNPDFYASPGASLVSASLSSGVFFADQNDVYALNADGSVKGSAFGTKQRPWPRFDAKNAENDHYAIPGITTKAWNVFQHRQTANGCI